MKFPLFAIFMTEKILNRPFQVWHMENKKVGATDVSFPQKSDLRARRRNEVSQKVLVPPFLSRKEGTKRWERRMCRSHGNLAYGRRGETKFRKKFFCLLFFQEKEEREVMRTTMAVRSSVACWGLLAMRSRASSLGLSP